MEPSSEQELKGLLEEGKITQDEYAQLNEALGRTKPDPETPSKISPGEFALRKRLLVYGFAVSCIGLPVGLALALPYVWGLSIAGILIGYYKMKSLGIIK